MEPANQSINRQQLVLDLKNIGIRKGDILLAHSSLSRMGHIEGGADTVIDALWEALGEKGTLLMPSFQSGGEHQILRQSCIFDLRTSPSEMGLITETFRLRKGVIRSLSPTHCTAGYGAHAEEILKDHQFCTVSVGKGSPYEKLIKMNGKILLLGVGHGNNTSLHYIENVNGAPTVCAEIFRPVVIDLEGRCWVVPTQPHMPGLSRRYNCPEVENEIVKASFQKNGKIGLADAKLVEAGSMAELIGKKIRQNPLYLINVFSH